MPTLFAAKAGPSTTSDLYTINPATGAPTSVGPSGFAITGLAIDPTTGICYGSTSVNSTAHPRSLISVNLATGAGTFIGAFGASAFTTMADLAFDSAGNLYGYESSSRSLWSINKTTGVATLIGTGASGDQFGLGLEIDAAGIGYVFPDGATDPSPFYEVALANGAVTLIGAIQNHFGSVFGGATAASFDASGVMWIWNSTSSQSQLLTVTPGGVVTLIGNPGSSRWDALVWQGGVKPNPWFTPPSTLWSEDFDECPLTTPVDCSTPTGPLISTDGASQGPSSLKVNARTGDAWIEANPVPTLPGDGNWVWTSFALYIPSWADIWDSGAAWTPQVAAFRASTNGFYLQPTSPTTGEIDVNPGGGGAVGSTPIPDGQWVAVEVARLRTSSFEQWEFWIDNVDSGILTPPGFQGSTTDLLIGDLDWGGLPPANGVLYYVDDFNWDTAGRIGPVDLSAKFFNGIGSGIDIDACTCAPIVAHPVDDLYATTIPRTLNVFAPGVMSNDILPTTVSLNTGPAHGSLIFNTDGSFSYTPDPTFVGDDTFVYNGNGGTAVVTITVTVAAATAVFSGDPVLKVEA